MSAVERIWWAARGWSWFPRWEIFQLLAIVAGAAVVARCRDGKLLRAYAAGIVIAAAFAVGLGNGGEWASFLARGAKGSVPELEIAGFGAIAGLVLGYVAVARIGYRRRSARVALDALAPAVGAMIALARIGCFFAGCDFGAPTAMAWGLRYPHLTPAFRAQRGAGLVHMSDARTLPVHPTQLYESLLGLGVVALALAWPRWRRARAHAGERFGISLLAYAAGRFAIDFVRGDLARGGLGLTVTQWLSIAIAAGIGAAWCASLSARAAASPHPDDLPSSPGSRRSSPPTALS